MGKMKKRALTFTVAALAAGLGTGTAYAGLMVHLTFDSQSGGVSADASGNGNDATLLGNAAIDTVTYKVGGGALTLDGFVGDGGSDSSHAVITGYKGIGGGADRAVSFWVNTSDPSAASNNGPTMISWGDTPNGQRYDINASTGSDKLRIEVQGGFDSTASVAALYDGNWHHVVVVLDSSLGAKVSENTVMYIDGVGQAATSTSSRVINTILTNDVEIGDSFHSGTREFQGLIDDVQIYDNVLSSDDARFLFNNPGTAVPEPGSIALLGLSALAFIRRRR